MRREELKEELKSIFEIRNALLAGADIPTVIHTALETVAARLLPQAASIFLFSKEGYLERVGIRGVDKDGRAIPNDWFRDERHGVGASFTGRAARPAPGSRFGEPQWSANLDEEQVDDRSKRAYREKLGEVRSVVSVPLNGRHRTFGVLEVINRLDEQGRRPDSDGGVFSVEDVYHLSLIGMNLATAITGLRRKNELDTLNEISRMLVGRVDADLDSAPHPVYQYTVNKLVDDLSQYKACILRVCRRADNLEVVAKAGKGVVWDKSVLEPLRIGAVTGDIYETGEPVFVRDVEERKDKFRTYEWIRANGLKSYAGFPLRVEEKILGTLSVFVGFNYEFYPDDATHLNNITYLLAAFTRNLNNLKELGALNAEKEQLLKYARDVAFTREYEDVMHEYKDDLFNIQHALKTSDKSSPGRKSQIIQEQIAWITKRVNEITELLGESAVAAVPVNLNHVIRSLTKLFTADKKTLRVSYDLDPRLPNIMASEAEMRDIVFNLVSNAVKAVEKSGQKHGLVAISTGVIEEREMAFLQLSVADNGVGIKREEREKIFRKRFSTNEGGTGLGLHITRKIVSAYGGKITFASTVGKGTTFTVKIPLEWNQEGKA
jgi:GAF domain-containing protein/two-component sensor histidine kinase